MAACTAAAVLTVVAPAWGSSAAMDTRVVAMGPVSALVTVHGPVQRQVWQTFTDQGVRSRQESKM